MKLKLAEIQTWHEKYAFQCETEILHLDSDAKLWEYCILAYLTHRIYWAYDYGDEGYSWVCQFPKTWNCNSKLPDKEGNKQTVSFN